jgi:hypothetical protein
VKRCLRMFVVAVAMLGAVALFDGASAYAEGPQDDPSTAAYECTVTVAGKSIQALCGDDYGFGYTRITYDGRDHVFVVRASDRAVSHIWQACRGCSTYSNWTGLGGTALSGVYAFTYDSGRSLEIYVWGTFNGYWCNDYNDPGARGRWTGWYDC